MAVMDELLDLVKKNLIITYDNDDELLRNYIKVAVAYAESYQHIPTGTYSDGGTLIPPTTEQGIIMLASHFYESRDGSTGGFFADSVQASKQVWDVCNRLFYLDRVWTM
jgi:uncharacterized phage protein (predicted DNA packaging)